jgi:hypothetical protein
MSNMLVVDVVVVSIVRFVKERGSVWFGKSRPWLVDHYAGHRAAADSYE